MALEQRISRLEGAYEQVDKRLDDLNRGIESLRAEVGSLRAEVNGRFNNLYVLLGASWATLIGAMIGLYFR
jgi:tetrahydromethanopterin S-methyltransferase subunit G